MRNKLKYSFACLTGAAMLAFSSCSDISDINVDPNQPTAVPAENLLTEAEFTLNNRLWSRSFNAEWPMLMVQHWAQNEYAEESRFNVNGTSFDTDWIDLYSGVLKELQSASDIITANEILFAGVKANQLAIIDILNVHTFHNLTDAYGSIPYKSALNINDNSNPAYDSQSAIYTDLVAKLRTAIGNLDPSSSSFDSGELIYGGDPAMWKKLGNSLLLRIAMRMSDVDQSAATAAISGLTPDALIASNAENAMFGFDSNPTVANPLYVDLVVGDRDDFCVTDVLIDNLTAMGDSRLDAFAALNASGNYVGMPSGLLDDDAFALKPNCSRPSDAVRGASAPAIIMDYAEVSFLLAEAYQRGMLTGTAADAYETGIIASMEYWGISDVGSDTTAVADYITANPYDAANWKESIGWQKWIAFYMNGPQAWAEWRRLDYPQLTVPDAALNDAIPVRLPYPLSEQTSNTSALGVVTSTPNDLSTKMWWDVN